MQLVERHLIGATRLLRVKYTLRTDELSLPIHPERAELSVRGDLSGIPLKVSSEIDVFPSERGEMLKMVVVDNNPVALQLLHGGGEIHGIRLCAT